MKLVVKSSTNNMVTGWTSIWCDLTHNTDQIKLLEGYRYTCYFSKSLYHFNSGFAETPGLALPLIALQYHEVKLNINSKVLQLETILKYTVTASSIDTDERRRFAQVSHEYLIEQTQFSNVLSAGNAGSNEGADY